MGRTVWASLLLVSPSACHRETVAHRLTERESNRILLVLGRENIQAESITDALTEERAHP